ncbi:MAG: hypothetical protein M3R27_12685 [Bacteroidota bacterium]|nr:hypothetical protein [Bacteroidota bacterium]
MNQSFFSSIAEILQDKEITKITITKVGEDLTLLVNHKNLLYTISGEPGKIDEEVIATLKEVKPEKKAYTVTVAEAPESENEEEEDGDDKEDETAIKIKALEKHGDALLKKKSFVEAHEKFKEARELNKDSKTIHLKMKKVEVELNKQVKKLIASGDAAMKKKSLNSAEDFYCQANELNKLMEVKDEALEAKLKACSPTTETTDEVQDVVDVEFETELEVVKEEEKAPEPEKPANDNKKLAFDYALKKGRDLMAERKYDEALVQFTQAVELFPDNKDALTEKAKSEKWIKMVAEL